MTLGLAVFGKSATEQINRPMSFTSAPNETGNWRMNNHTAYPHTRLKGDAAFLKRRLDSILNEGHKCSHEVIFTFSLTVSGQEIIWKEYAV
jgi:hypothetical protein